MKIAIIQDELVRKGGAEQVVLSMLKAFPNADLFTLCYNANNTFPEYKKYKVNTSVFQYITTNDRLMQMLFFPFGILAMKLLKVKNYDIVIVSNTHCSKYASISAKSKIFMYTYTPFRLAWNPTSYSEYNNSKGIKKVIFNSIISLLRRIDFKAAQKANYFMGMTEETAQRIRDAYGVKEVKIIPPPVKTENFFVSKNPKNYYLVVSRLEFYKKVDLVVEAFNDLGLPLIVVGNGSKKEELIKMAKSNVQFKSNLSKEEIAQIYSECKAFIFPQHEDYGITPLEANASGRPVIAYKAGGVLETMIPYCEKTNQENFTAIFFDEQTKHSLKNAVIQFENIVTSINSMFIRNNAEKFNELNFINQFKAYIQDK